MGAAPDLSEPQAFKNVSLRNGGVRNIHFSWYISRKNCTTVKLLTFDMIGQSGSGRGTLLPPPASASTSTKICRFRILEKKEENLLGKVMD